MIRSCQEVTLEEGVYVSIVDSTKQILTNLKQYETLCRDRKYHVLALQELEFESVHIMTDLYLQGKIDFLKGKTLIFGNSKLVQDVNKDNILDKNSVVSPKGSVFYQVHFQEDAKQGRSVLLDKELRTRDEIQKQNKEINSVARYQDVKKSSEVTQFLCEGATRPGIFVGILYGENVSLKKSMFLSGNAIDSGRK